MKLFVPKEVDSNESRVATSPETTKKLVALGFDVCVESDAGSQSRILNAEYEQAGASIGKSADASKADVILKVRRPSEKEAASYKKGAIVIATMDPFGNEKDVKAMAKAGLTSFAMEFMPRITRAQSMDVLSSQANLAGYQAVMEAAITYDRALPMMMTAAGTVPAAKVFVMGVGVAGLQAIATARRLGAIVTATDVRPATKEQVESLGAKFVAVEDDEFRSAETSGGYAKEMSKEYQVKQAELVASHIAKQDIVITTALIPGRPAPRLVSKEMLQSMRAGSVLVDLAVERGGNVEGAMAGAIMKVGDVSIVGHLNMPGRIASTASLLYAKNLLNFLETMVDKEKSELAIDWEDELAKATCLTHEGKIVHEAFANVQPAKVSSKAKSKPASKKPNTAKKPKAAKKPDGDDLTKIKGIGPQNRTKLAKIGIKTFADVAALTKTQQQEIGEKLAFPGRIEREDWVKQAADLVAKSTSIGGDA